MFEFYKVPTKSFLLVKIMIKINNLNNFPQSATIEWE